MPTFERGQVVRVHFPAADAAEVVGKLGARDGRVADAVDGVIGQP